ncbi:MAG: bacteriohemerythrin [Deltaproteobacteria bacterium]|nr:bacteriohemerythrin [Deltaproteobacteria bacterium]
MNAITWKDEYSVEIPSIDEQHKKLVQIINDLNINLIKGGKKEAISLILFKLSNYTVSHFRHEELIFDKLQYEHRENHKKEHKDFIEKIEMYQKKFEDGALNSSDMMAFLLNWLVNHILKSDKKYTACFLENAVA